MNGLDLAFIVAAVLLLLALGSWLTRHDPQWWDAHDYRDRWP